MASDKEHSQELSELRNAVELYNSKWNGEDRMTRLTLLLALNDDPVALLAGPPVRNNTVAVKTAIH